MEKLYFWTKCSTFLVEIICSRREFIFMNEIQYSLRTNHIFRWKIMFSYQTLTFPSKSRIFSNENHIFGTNKHLSWGIRKHKKLSNPTRHKALPPGHTWGKGGHTIVICISLKYKVLLIHIILYTYHIILWILSYISHIL